MKPLLIIFSMLLVWNTTVSPKAYEYLKAENLTTLKEGVSYLSAQESTDQNKAYIGTIYMKMAGYESTPKTKLDVFRKGHDMLESVILTNQSNGEYRYLRLIIQENAPSILMYNSNITEDVNTIEGTFSDFSKTLQKIVLDYAKQSNALSHDKLLKTIE